MSSHSTSKRVILGKPSIGGDKPELLPENESGAIENANIDNAFFCHPRLQIDNEAQLTDLLGMHVDDKNCFKCNFLNVLETAEKIVKVGFHSIFYILDHNREEIFATHQKDKLFLAIEEKLGNKLNVAIIKDGKVSCIK